MKKKILSAALAVAATMSLTTAFAAEPGDTETPGGSSDATKVTIKVPGKIEGADLNKAMFGETGKTWADVEKVTFTSTEAFSVQFSTTAETTKDTTWFTMGVDEDKIIARADDAADKFKTSWTLDDKYISLFDTSKDGGAYVKLTNEDEKTEFTVEAEITFKAGGTTTPDNKNTGIALAIAPAGLAVAFVTVAAVMSKKKRG